MPKTTVYLDSSVPSAYFDDRAPDRQRLTREFWHDRLGNFQACVSPLVRQEVSLIPDPGRREQVEALIVGMPDLTAGPEVEGLARQYIQRGIFPERYLIDALHVAIAVHHRAAYVVSWNFKHLVRVQTRREVNLVNALLGHEPIEIVAPPEV